MYEPGEKTQMYLEKIKNFMDRHIYPNEERLRDEIDQGDRWEPPPLLEELKARARDEQLWNLFLPDSRNGAGLTNLEYAPLAEIMAL